MAHAIKLADQGIKHLVFGRGEPMPKCGVEPVTMRAGAVPAADHRSHEEKLYARDKNFHTYWATRPLTGVERTMLDKLKGIINFL